MYGTFLTWKWINKSWGIISEEKHYNDNNKFNAILNETLFNSRIKEKISNIKNDIYVNNNIKEKNQEKNKKYYLNHKLRTDPNIDYYEFLLNELNNLDESKLLENVFSEFLLNIKFKFWKKDSFDNFKNSLNNCKLYDLLKLNNNFDTYISNAEFSTNKNHSSSIYNSKSELLREGSHSINDSQSSQTIENNMDKN